MIMTDFESETQGDLGGIFAAAKREIHDLPIGLMDRILVDANTVQEGFVVVLPDRAASSGLFRGLRDMLGGWPAMAGLTVACATGIWLGVSPPDALPDPFEIAGLLQDDLDMFDADGLTAGWIERRASLDGGITE